MSDLTYTAKGTFDRNGKVNVNVCIPSEPKPNTYRTEVYNMSKSISHGTINVIFCHFSNGSTDAMQHNTFDYRMNLDIYAMKNHTGATDFDESKNDALFLFFHNTTFDKSDRDIYFEQIEHIYNDFKQHGHQNQEGASANSSLNNPRKIGMSLVTKSPTH